jgi:hypothetical protein
VFLASVEDTENTILLDKKGNRITDKYILEPTIQNGLIKASKRKKADTLCYGFIDTKGNEIIPVKYENIVFQQSQNNLFFVSYQDKWGILDKKGELIMPYKYDHIENFQEGIAKVAYQDKWGLVNEKGTEIFACQYDYIDYKGNKIAKVAYRGKWGLVNEKGKMIMPYKYDDILHFNHGLAFAFNAEKEPPAVDGHYTYRTNYTPQGVFIDKKGKEYIPDYAYSGVYCVKGRWGYLVAHKPSIQYDYAFALKNGMGKVVLKNKVYYIRTATGEYVDEKTGKQQRQEY